MGSEEKKYLLTVVTEQMTHGRFPLILVMNQTLDFPISFRPAENGHNGGAQPVIN